MLGDNQPLGRQVVNLSFLNAFGLLIRQRTVAEFAQVHMVDFDVIRLVGHFERMPLMARLSAGLLFPFLAETFRRGFFEAVARGRLAAVTRRFGNLSLNSRRK
jgi:hypothetical protein